MKPGKHDRDLVGLERSLGFRSNRGISRQSNKDWLPIQAIVQGMKRIAKEYVDFTTGEIRASGSLRQAVTDLFEEWAPTIWPDEDQPQPDWLEDPDPYRFEGRYPKRLHYNNEADREALRDLFYNLVVEKCCNYHSNQLQRQRTSQRASLDYLESAGETPRKLESGVAESDSEMVDPDAAPPKHFSSYDNNDTFEGREAQYRKPGDFAFRVWQDYGMPDSGAATVKTTTEPAPPATAAISWTPANMAPKESTQEPTPSETATSDRPDRPTRPKRKRPEPEEVLPKKVSGDRKAKKPRWSQIIPLKVSPYHLARLANGERIAPTVPTSPEETPPPPHQEDTIMSNGDEEHGGSNAGSLSSLPSSPSEEFAPENDTINVKQDVRSQSPSNKPAPASAPAPAAPAEPAAEETREVKSPVEKPVIDPPLSNGTSRPQSARPGSESAPASRPATSHRETEPSKPPPPSLTAPRKETAPVELKWRPLTNPSSRSPLPAVNGLHSHHPSPVQSARTTSQNGDGGGRPLDRDADAVGGADRHPSQPFIDASRFDWQSSHRPGQQQRRETQPLATAPVSDPHAAHRSQISLVEEVLGHFIDCPTAREMLRKSPNLSRPQLEDMKRILAHSVDAQTNFDVFTAHVYGRRDDGPNGNNIATALASAVPAPSGPPFVPPSGAAMPKFPQQHVLPSNGDSTSPHLGAPAPPPTHPAREDVERILGDLASHITVQQILYKKPDIRRRELKIIRDILKNHPESRTNLAMLSSKLEERDREGDRSSSTEVKAPPPPGPEPPRGIAMLSPRVTPAHGNPFNAFDSKQHTRPQQHAPTNVAEPERPSRYSIIRSPPTSEGGRRQDTPQHIIESNPARQQAAAPPPPPPGIGSFRPAAPPTPAEITQPPQNAAPTPPNFVHVQHAHGGFGRMPSVPGQGNVGPQHPHPHPHPQHPHHAHHPQHPQQTATPTPNPNSHGVGPGRSLMGQQDVFAVRPPPHMQNDKDQQRVNIPIRGPSMHSEPEVQTPQHLNASMSMSPTPAAANTHSLDDISIEINWARNVERDYTTMEACSHCKTAGEFFALIEGQMPDELQGINGNGNRIKEIKVRAITPLPGIGHRIKRDEASGRMALKNLVKKLRAQPAGAEIELEFLVVWE